MAAAVDGEVVGIPEYTTLAAVYAFEDATDRYRKIHDAFVAAYGEPPELYARAPGRVNLIGEHIDYEGYGVLPMAIQQDTVVAIRKGGTKLAVASLLPDKYPPTEFDPDPKQEVDTEQHSWANYFLAAYKGVFDHLTTKGATAPEPVGLQVLIHGVVPTGAGVSSSSAFVVASALAVLSAHGLAASTSAAEVADLTCLAERHVGVASGGMDQAISVMGQTGLAKLIEFHPVRATDVVLPEGATFVVANSLAHSHKAMTAPKQYNLRVVECRLASALLAVSLGASRAEAVSTYTTLKSVEPLVAAKHGGVDKEQLKKAVMEALHEEAYTQDEIECALSVKLEQLYESNPASLRVVAVAKESGYKLQQRALHVWGEARRVTAFKDAAEASTPTEEKLAALGALMDSSHASCSGLYECSCPELEELVKVEKAAGALGSRLTGAGWGGCTVSLIREASTEAFITAVREGYFNKLIEAGSLQEAQLHEVLFASKPSSGAAILRLAPDALAAAVV